MVQQMDIKEQQVDIHNQTNNLMVSVPRSHLSNRSNPPTGHKSEYFLLNTTGD